MDNNKMNNNNTKKKKKISNIVEIIKMKIKIISLNKTKIKKIKCKIWK